MRKHLIWARAKANDRFFTWCSSILRSKQQPRVISPSVAPLYPLGAPAPSSEGAEAAPPQTADLLSVSAVEPRALCAGGSLRFNSVPPPLQNVRARRAHLHFSCAQRARFMRRRRASCAQRVHFICKAKNAASAAFFCCSLTYLCKQQCLFRCRGRRAEAHRRI